METRFLLLEDGTLYQGQGFGADAPTLDEPSLAAEVVFNTSMTGYQEILTDPSYRGQMVVMTYPHIGNYGCDPVFDEALGSPSPISCSALIMRSAYEGHLPRKRVSLNSYLKTRNIAGINGLDTRSLTIHLRNTGSQNGLIFQTGSATLTDAEYAQALQKVRSFPRIGQRSLIEEVATQRVVTDPQLEEVPMPKGDLRFALVDFGIKRSIIAELYRRNVNVTLFPPTATAEEILAACCDAMLLSNGPGDPALLQDAITMTREVVETLPVFGICLGHQLITWALGGRTLKLKYGHHGGNHPVVDLRSGACFVTSQNHGYASDPDSLPSDVQIWLRNANDNSIEGLFHTTKPICCVQFHPEASPGPQDASWIFDTFIDKAKEAKA